MGQEEEEGESVLSLAIKREKVTQKAPVKCLLEKLMFVGCWLVGWLVGRW